VPWLELPIPERDGAGLPIVSALETRVSRLVVLLATLGFALAATWEIGAAPLAGHYASSASVGIIADNMLHWGIGGPVWDYSATQPSPTQYYCHHPWGIFWTSALAMKLLGRHDFVLRLVPVLLSAATPPLLYMLGRALWRPFAGAVAAAAFVVLPISLAFAHFNALEVPVMCWSLLGLWGFVRFHATGRRRHLAASLLGFALALHADWPAYLLLGGLLAFALVRAFALQRWFGRVNWRRYLSWWVLAATLAGVTLLLYLALFHRSGKLADLLGSYRGRSSGNDQSLAQVLAARRYWIELSFTPIAIALGKLAAALAVARLVVLRREHEVLPLLVLFMASVQYVVFKQGADVHVFWPHYFAAFFALGMGALVDTAASVAARLGGRARAGGPGMLGRRGLAMVAALGLLPLAAVARDGIATLGYARASGGRFNEKGLLIHSDGDKNAFLRWLEPQLAVDERVGTHIGMKVDWSQLWTLRRVTHQNLPLPRRPHPHYGRLQRPPKASIYLSDTRYLWDELGGSLAKRFAVGAVGPFWFVRPTQAAAPIEAYRFEEREPGLLERYLGAAYEPRRTVVPDPFATWELRVHYGQPADAPPEPPGDFEQRRVAHNIAVAAGDPSGAAKWLAQLEGELSPPKMRFDDGSELLGVRLRPGAAPQLTLLWRASGPSDHDVQPEVRGRVIAAARWSTTMADPTVRIVSPPLGIAPLRWRAGFVYSQSMRLIARPGQEQLELAFRLRRGRPTAKKGSTKDATKRDAAKKPMVPRPTDGSKSVKLLVLR
jgi:4-amino-4-deoxy-L-arabinose transferase-like glycosyltransferase